MFTIKYPGRIALIKAVLLTVVWLTATACPGRELSTDQPIRELNPDQPVSKQIAPGQEHRYSFQVEREGLIVEIDIEQDGVDVITHLVDPQGNKVISADRTIDYIGPEKVLVVTGSEGTFTLRVEAFDLERPPGRYRLELRKLRPAIGKDVGRARAALWIYQGENGQDLQTEALTYSYAVEVSRQAQDQFWYAEALYRQCQALLRQGEAIQRQGGDLEEKLSVLRMAVEQCLKASAAYRATGDQRMEGWARLRIGFAFYLRGEISQAISYYEEAIALFNAVDDHVGEAEAFRNIGQISRIQGRWDSALESYGKSLELLNKDPERDQAPRAKTLHNLGVLYRLMGEDDLALSYLEQAVQAWDVLQLKKNSASSWNQIGSVHELRGEFLSAKDAYENSRGLREPDSDGMANTLANLGNLMKNIAPAEALFHLNDSLSILGDGREFGLEVWAKANFSKGSLFVAEGRFEQALPLLRTAEESYGKIKNPADQAASILEISKAQAGLENLEVAVNLAEEARDLVEEVELWAIRPELRSEFFPSVYTYFENLIALQMSLDRQDPSEGFDALALQFYEQGVNRSLRETLLDPRRDVILQEAPELVRWRQLREELNDIVRWELDRAGNREVPSSVILEQASQWEDRREKIKLELHKLEITLRRKVPRYAALSVPESLDLVGIQREVLDDDTLLLEYFLGSRESYLWVVGNNSMDSFDLPGRQVLRTLVEDFLAIKAQVESGEILKSDLSVGVALRDLSRQLLGPADDLIKGKRLAIVSGGILQNVPFSAMLDPTFDQPTYLIANHEITRLPSASVLKDVRQEAASREPAPRRVAVLADPVFNLADERFPQDLRSNESDRRLKWTKSEAESIEQVVGKARSYLALGFKATRDVVLGGKLAGFSILHFATHADAEQRIPVIELTAFDQNGDEIGDKGNLNAFEIASLHLPAELAVLSGCSTAIGANVPGEGLASLARAFMAAGTERVIASLWLVDDQATTALMESFYKGLIIEERSPSAALQQAQIESIASGVPDWDWAAFEHYGDWRGTSQ